MPWHYDYYHRVIYYTPPEDVPTATEQWHSKLQRSGARRVTPSKTRMRELRRMLTRELGYVCQACLEKKRASELSAHHIYPRSKGGSDARENLALLCHECHDWVEIEGFRKYPTEGSIYGVYHPKTPDMRP